MAANVKCIYCKKIIKRDGAFKVSNRRYCCSELEYNGFIKNNKSIKNSNNIIMSIFKTEMTGKYIMIVNRKLKSIRLELREEEVLNLSRDVFSRLEHNRIFQGLPLPAKISYLIKVLDSKKESHKLVNIPNVSMEVTENTDIKYTKKGRLDISNLIERVKI